MDTPKKKLLTISEAAEYLGISEASLRRWHKDGTFLPTYVSSGRHRYYSISDLDQKTKGLFQIAKEWVYADQGVEPASDFYCQTSDRFKTRLTRFAEELQSRSGQIDGPLLLAIAGEIGNNSFDHNLGMWPDIPGALFGSDIGKRQIVLADRGVGIFETLRRVKPSIATHTEALRIAFSEVLSGRAPEHRGNGLKFVRESIGRMNVELFFQSGDAILKIKEGQEDIVITKSAEPIHGCLAFITY